MIPINKTMLFGLCFSYIIITVVNKFFARYQSNHFLRQTLEFPLIPSPMF